MSNQCEVFEPGNSRFQSTVMKMATCEVHTKLCKFIYAIGSAVILIPAGVLDHWYTLVRHPYEAVILDMLLFEDFWIFPLWHITCQTNS